MNQESFNNWEYALFSAHIYQYIPEIPWSEHEGLFEKWKQYHRPKPLQTDRLFRMPLEMDLIVSHPSLLCLYHLGLHGQLPIKLAEAGLHFDILLDRKVYETQLSYFTQMKVQLDKAEREYRFLMSDDPTVLLQIRSAIKQGKHMLIFADGNSGVQASSANKIEINFFDGSLLVRQGIGLISYLFRVPIIPFTHEEKCDEIIVKLADRIAPDAVESRMDYIRRSTQLLYHFLEAELRSAPWKWECWGYLHQMDAFTEYKDESSVSCIIVDSATLIKLKLNNKTGNFDRKNYCFYY